MTRINNLNGQRALVALKEQARSAGLNSPMNNSGIGEGGIEVYDQGTINVSDGNLIVNGTATISGVLNADGTVTLSGTITISGPLTISGATGITGPLTVTGATHLNGTTDVAGDTTVTGDFDVNGPMKTTSTLSVEGVTTLKNDLNVTGDGKIVAGQTTIRPSGAINLGDSLTIAPAGEFGPGGISDGFASYTLTPGGGAYFHTFTGGAYIDGRVNAMDLILSSLPTTSSPANLYIGSDGVVKRSTA
jgi:cytoskeletal protein CcmA (bactofilin family)